MLILGNMALPEINMPELAILQGLKSKIRPSGENAC